MNYPPPVPGLLVGALILVAIGSLECAVFLFMYRKAEKGPEGRHLSRLSFWLGTTMALTVIGQIIPVEDYWVILTVAVIQLVVFLFIDAELWVRIMLLHDNRKARRKAEKAALLQSEQDHLGEALSPSHTPTQEEETPT